MYEARQGVAVKKPYVQCMVTSEENFSGQTCYAKSFRETWMVGRTFLEIITVTTASVSMTNK